MRCRGDVLEWRKLTKRQWSPDKAVQRGAVVSVDLAPADGTRCTFQVIANAGSVRTLTLRAVDPDSARAAIQGLRSWAFATGLGAGEAMAPVANAVRFNHLSLLQAAPAYAPVGVGSSTLV